MGQSGRSSSSSTSSRGSSSPQTFRSFYSTSAVSATSARYPPVYTPPPPQRMVGGTGSFLSTVKDGFAIGIGSSLASHAVSSVLGPPSASPPALPPAFPPASPPASPPVVSSSSMTCDMAREIMAYYEQNGDKAPQMVQDFYNMCANKTS